ncbi:hypothetical protein DH2020_022146 [Rehmannia glutinosa]|uniref:Dolichyl-phosphate beta-glucosyltransferase n=1 Tax=Rehmannia glutinosa TaxID=99300 RepID=A0ABR0WCJ3_REHGL
MQREHANTSSSPDDDFFSNAKLHEYIDEVVKNFQKMKARNDPMHNDPMPRFDLLTPETESPVVEEQPTYEANTDDDIYLKVSCIMEKKMGFIWTLVELLSISASVFALGLVAAVVFATYRRKCSHSCHAEAAPIFEDPNSLKPVNCPHILDPAEKYISLIIPAYNEEHRLPGALDETLNYLKERAGKDKSFSYEGMLHSRGELLLMLDADGATKVTDLEKLENQIHAVAIKERKFGDSSATDLNLRISDVPIAAFGSRAHLEEKALSTRKWYRNFLMKGFHLVVLLAAGPGIRDTQCGFKMFTRAAARKLFMNIRLKRWCFDVELVYLCKLFRIPMIEISVNWSEIPGSKVNLFSIPNMLWELALMSVGYRTGIWTIHS